MKNLRLNILTLSSVIAITLLSSIWIQNSYHLDILMTKSLHYENKILNDVKSSNDVVFIQQKYIELLEIKQQNQIKKNEIIGKTMLHTGIVIFLLVINLIILIIEFFKRKKVRLNEQSK